MAKRNNGIYYAIGKGFEKWFEYSRGQGLDSLEALFALGGLAIAAVLLFVGAAVAVCLLVGIVALLILILTPFRINLY